MVPCVGQPRVMLTVSKQTVIKKNVTICNIKLSQHTSKCDGIVLNNVIMKFDSDSPPQKWQTSKCDEGCYYQKLLN